MRRRYLIYQIGTPLTNVYNRRYIFEQAEEIIEECKGTGKGLCVCLLDIDYFKEINDKHGHQFGDYVLKSLTSIISENLHPADLLGRYGGEEFIIILRNTNKSKASLAIQRILDIIRNKHFIFEEKSIQLTFSAGISHCTEAQNPKRIMDDLVKFADQRMYQAKNKGRNKIVF